VNISKRGRLASRLASPTTAASQALVDLAGDIKMEEAVMDERGDDDDDDREEGWVEPCNGMLQVDQDELDAAVHPVQLVLVKVSSNSDQTVMISWYSH